VAEDALLVEADRHCSDPINAIGKSALDSRPPLGALDVIECAIRAERVQMAD